MAAATINVDDNTTISCPTPNPGGGSGDLADLARRSHSPAPPLVVSHGSHALTRTTSRAQHDEPSGAQASHAMRVSGWPVTST